MSNPSFNSPMPKGPAGACLFVASLSLDTTEEDLYNLFSPHGNVLKITLKEKTSKPYAFVQFDSIQDALAATEHVQGVYLHERRIRVERAKVNRTLFVAKLGDLTAQDLRKYMEEFGEVESVTLMFNHHNNQSRGCGFVKYQYREDAEQAIQFLKELIKAKRILIEGEEENEDDQDDNNDNDTNGDSEKPESVLPEDLDIENDERGDWIAEWASSNNDPESLGVNPYQIYVGGLNTDDITEEKLREKFETYGEIEDITLFNEQQSEQQEQERVKYQALLDQGVSDAELVVVNSFSFIRYKEAKSASLAIENENGAEWLDRCLRVEYCESTEMKNKRRFRGQGGRSPGGYRTPRRNNNRNNNRGYSTGGKGNRRSNNRNNNNNSRYSNNNRGYNSTSKASIGERYGNDEYGGNTSPGSGGRGYSQGGQSNRSRGGGGGAKRQLLNDDYEGDGDEYGNSGGNDSKQQQQQQQQNGGYMGSSFFGDEEGTGVQNGMMQGGMGMIGGGIGGGGNMNGNGTGMIPLQQVQLSQAQMAQAQQGTYPLIGFNPNQNWFTTNANGQPQMHPFSFMASNGGVNAGGNGGGSGVVIVNTEDGVQGGQLYQQLYFQPQQDGGLQTNQGGNGFQGGNGGNSGGDGGGDGGEQQQQQQQ